MTVDKTENPNVYQRISAVMADVAYIQKDDFVSTGGSNGYKAVSEEKVTNTIRAALIKHGLTIVPIEQVHTRTDEMLTDRAGNPRVNRLSTVDVKYRIQNIDDKDDYIIVASSGTGVDTQDKGVGKAMTYAYKYMLLRTFAIPTGDDPDKISSDVYSSQFESQKADKPKEDKPKTDNTDYSVKLAELIRAKGINKAEYVIKHGINKSTPMSEYKRLYEEMQVC